MKVKSSLMCQNCGRQTSHELHYVGSSLHEIRCLQCSAETWGHHHPVAGYVGEMRGRIVTKPLRVLREMTTDPATLRSLLPRVATKPVRVASELIEILR